MTPFGSVDPATTLQVTLTKRIDTAADDQQAQIDALEQLVLRRAALVDVARDGRKLKFTFTRRGEVHVVECYADMATDVAAIRKALLDD